MAKLKEKVAAAKAAEEKASASSTITCSWRENSAKQLSNLSSLLQRESRMRPYT